MADPTKTLFSRIHWSGRSSWTSTTTPSSRVIVRSILDQELRSGSGRQQGTGDRSGMKWRLPLSEIGSGLPIGPVEGSQKVIEQSGSIVMREHRVKIFRKKIQLVLPQRWCSKAGLENRAPFPRQYPGPHRRNRRQSTGRDASRWQGALADRRVE